MTANDGRAELSASLETALLRELAASWERENAFHFRRSMGEPMFALSEAKDFLAQWQLSTRTIVFARGFVLNHPWSAIIEVLKHEMAHQFAHEVLGAINEPAHGPAFRSVCDRMGIDKAASGLPPGSDEGDSPVGRILRRIEKLLALAGSANKHEAESAMATAQKLMLEHNIAALSDATARRHTFREAGEPTRRMQRHEKLLAGLLASHFFVRVIQVPSYRPTDGTRGTVVEVSGSHENVEMAVYVHAFLLRAAGSLWGEHKRARGIDSDKGRLAFLAGVMKGFSDKLTSQKKALAQTGLVWIGDAAVDAYFERRHPRVRTTRFQTGANTDAHAHGKAAGRQIVIHRPIDEGTTARGRLLHGRSD